uniref:Uncharacterized protein n=1 Tax=Aegilops tauschii subsp. strangulata TaxID=200361 RepID=A0A453AKJ4_AEGTS
FPPRFIRCGDFSDVSAGGGSCGADGDVGGAEVRHTCTSVSVSPVTFFPRVIQKRHLRGDDADAQRRLCGISTRRHQGEPFTSSPFCAPNFRD